MTILITGAGGQLGRALQARFAGQRLLALTHSDLDIGDRAAVLGLASAQPSTPPR